MSKRGFFVIAFLAVILSLIVAINASNSVTAAESICADPESQACIDYCIANPESAECTPNEDGGDEPIPGDNPITPTLVSSCGYLSVPGSYILNDSISSDTTCLYINSSDVSLDCQGNSIFYGSLGEDNSYGIFAQAKGVESNLTIQNCNIVKANNASGRYSHGIYVRKYQNSSLMNNSIETSGKARNYGIRLYSTKDLSISNNAIITSGIRYFNYGIYEYLGTRNTISNNAISTQGTGSNQGIRLIKTNSDNILSNTISTNGRDSHGFSISGRSTGNLFKDNSLNGISGNAVHFITGSINPFNNVFQNNSLFNITGYDFYADAYINGTSFIDQNINSFNILKNSGDLVIQNTQFGKIVLNDGFSAEGSNLGDYFRFEQEKAYLYPGFTDLNAEITIIPYHNDSVLLFKDIICPEFICSITDPSAITFTAKEAGEYSLYSIPYLFYEFPTLADNSLINTSSIYVNVSIYGSTAFTSNLTINLFNAPSFTSSGSTNESSLYLEFANLLDGVYYFNSSVHDAFSIDGESQTGIIYYAPTRQITIDTTAPSIEFTSPSDTSASKTDKIIRINVTAQDSLSGLSNLTISLYNSTSLISVNSTTSNNIYLEFTGLADGVYYFNATALDNAGNTNSTSTNNVTIFTPAQAPSNPSTGGSSGGGGSSAPLSTGPFIDNRTLQSTSSFENLSLPNSESDTNAGNDTANTDDNKSFITGAITGLFDSKGKIAGLILAVLIIILAVYRYLVLKKEKLKKSKK